jgi:hypothetical protein
LSDGCPGITKKNASAAENLLPEKQLKAAEPDINRKIPDLFL